MSPHRGDFSSGIPGRVCLEAHHPIRFFLPGTASVPGGRAEAGTQWARAGGHQPGPESPGAAAGAKDQWKCPSLLCPLLRRTPRAPESEKRKGSCSQGSTIQPHSAILTGPLTSHHHIRSQDCVYKSVRAPRLGKAYSSVPLPPGAWWLCFPRLYSRGTNFITSQRHTHIYCILINSESKGPGQCGVLHSIFSVQTLPWSSFHHSIGPWG